jgi:hypothetical protein
MTVAGFIAWLKVAVSSGPPTPPGPLTGAPVAPELGLDELTVGLVAAAPGEPAGPGRTAAGPPLLFPPPPPPPHAAIRPVNANAINHVGDFDLFEYWIMLLPFALNAGLRLQIIRRMCVIALFLVSLCAVPHAEAR